MLFSRISQVAARFKNAAFSAEREVRYIQSEYPEMLPDFRQDGRSITLFVKIVSGNRFARPSDLPSKLPIVSVTLGPGGSHQGDVARQVLIDLMSACGYFPEVSLSSIPFRPS
jgi:hypothetical protein